MKARCGFAQPDRVLGQRLEDRLEIEGGPADHLEQLARRRLLLERHPQLAVASLQLGEQADVLDGDDGLVGEGLSSSICLSRERSDFASPDNDARRSARRPRSIGTASSRAPPRLPACRDRVLGILSARRGYRTMARSAIAAAGRAPRVARRIGYVSPQDLQFARVSRRGVRRRAAALRRTGRRSEGGAAQLVRAPDDGIEHRLDVGR